MSGTSKPRESRKPSINYNVTTVAGTFSELADVNDKVCDPKSSDNSRRNDGKYESKSSEILSTGELVSVMSQVWGRASRPLSYLQPRAKVRHKNHDLSEANLWCYSDSKGDVGPSAHPVCHYLPLNLMNIGHVSPKAQACLQFLTVSEKISSFGPQSWNSIHYILRDSSCRSFIILNEIQKEKSPTSLGNLGYLRDISKWLSGPSDVVPKQQLESTLVENQKFGECYVCNDSESTKSNDLRCTVSPANNLAPEGVEYTHGRIEVNGDVIGAPSSRLSEDVHSYASGTRKENEVVENDESMIDVPSPTYSKSTCGLAKQEHAFAGAMAGLSVSLCLHPVDTLKTVIQTCHADKRSISFIGRSIIFERGVAGLYRGIATRIASSAPISAIYTFSYESVKGILLPLLPVEYQSLAHCTAGGCASVATSFIFTPSERIKQQMQIGCHYQNSWKAVVGIITTGGLSSLYVGWSAVLCRNVPQSIIKFFAYESFKKLILSSREPDAHPDALQTLICGGLAGSTAALFSTPFDVVKTRLQTQIPGSVHQYNGIFNTLVNIKKNEGLKGLYRGLIPRLFIYLSQGAIFFASYEAFKKLFALRAPHVDAQTAECLQNAEDGAR